MPRFLFIISCSIRRRLPLPQGAIRSLAGRKGQSLTDTLSQQPETQICCTPTGKIYRLSKFGGGQRVLRRMAERTQHGQVAIRKPVPDFQQRLAVIFNRGNRSSVLRTSWYERSTHRL